MSPARTALAPVAVAALLAAAAAAAPAPATTTAATAPRVRSFVLVQVNQEERALARGGSARLCQAIPFTAIRAKLRAASGLRILLRAPGHRAHVRRVRGSTVEWVPRDAGLRGEAFVEGLYVVELKRGTRRVDRTTFRLRGSGATC